MTQGRSPGRDKPGLVALPLPSSRLGGLLPGVCKPREAKAPWPRGCEAEGGLHADLSLCTRALPAWGLCPVPAEDRATSSSKPVLLKPRCPLGLKFKATLGKAVWCQCLAWGFEGLQKPVLQARNWGASGAKGL